MPTIKWADMSNWRLRRRKEREWVEEILKELMARTYKLQIMNLKNEREFIGIDLPTFKG